MAAARLSEATLLPGIGLQPFRLGASLADVLALCTARPNSFRRVEVKYAAHTGGAVQQAPDIAVCFPAHGFHLLFDGRQQRLRLVEVHDTTRLQIRFGGHVFGAAQPPSFGRVCEAFGPTYPGEPTGGQYPLQYPGVLFLFPQPPAPQQQHQQQQQPQQQHWPGAGSGSELPVPLSTPASRIIIHHGSAASLAAAQAAPPPALPLGSTYFEAVEAVAGQGLLLCGGGQLLRFGDSPQDLTSELGQPSSTHTKPASSVPHGSGALLAAGGGIGAAPDFVYCYAQRGLDALFCGSSHRLKKLVLHANPPGHPNFGLYSKCNFRVHPTGSWSLLGLGGSCGEGGGESPLSSASDGGVSMKTAASHASQAATESPLGAQQGHGSGSSDGLGATGEPSVLAAGSFGQQRGQQQQRQQHDEREGQQGVSGSSGLSAAYGMLVGLIDDVIHIDGQGLAAGSGGSPASAAAAAPGANARAARQAGAEAAVVSAAEAAPSSHGGGGGAMGGALGRPPRPPMSFPISATPASKAGSKKKKKKDKARAAGRPVAARWSGEELAAGGGNGDTDTDASVTDSAPSSLASSPGMTSFMCHIAATGGSTSGLAAATAAGAAAAAAAAGRGATPPRGDSSDDSTAGFAGKERRLDCGSAFDGWSEADDLALLVGDDLPAGEDPATSRQQQSGDPDPLMPQRQPQRQQPAPGSRLRVSTAVQTVPAPDAHADVAAPLEGASADVACSPDSADSYVITDSPELFNESAAAAEYEAVPRQRSSGTQTNASLLAGQPPPRPGSSLSQLRRGVAGSSTSLAVSVESSVSDIQAAFGRGAKPALHTRLGGRHPYGPTHLYAYRGVVFEVLRSGSIATVTLFAA